MRRRSTGQSLVEMAFVAPILLVILFGIIDMGWLIFAYATVSQGARAGAEVAAQLPPYQSWLDYGEPGGSPGAPFTNIKDDKCVNTIVNAVRQDSVLFRGEGEGGLNGGRDIGASTGIGLDYIKIWYPDGAESRNLIDRGPIEVQVSYPVRPLTPLFSLLRLGNEEGNGDRSLNITITVRRSIENLGLSPESPIGVACAEDIDDWRRINQ
jgi:hypothetical protein